MDKVTNKDESRKVNEEQKIMNSIGQWKHCWMGHVLRHNDLLHESQKNAWYADKGKKITDATWPDKRCRLCKQMKKRTDGHSRRLNQQQNSATSCLQLKTPVKLLSK